MVGMTVAEYDELQDQLAAALQDAEKNKDGWQRAQADYSNLRRRNIEDRDQMRYEVIGDVVTAFLDIMDDLDLALQNSPKSEAENAWAEGIELVYRKLLGKLETQGVRVMEAEGEPFDPRFHEAITQEEDKSVKSGHIIAVVKPGYRIGNRVLRPAMVRVAA